MSEPAPCSRPRDVVAALPIVDEARVARARAEVVERPIAYALGSGESDEVALYAGVKPLIRQVLPATEIAAARARFGALGLALAEAEHRTALPSTEGRVLFVGRDPDRVRAAAACEAEPDHDRELGRILGYPRCCVEAYLAIPTPRRNPTVLARAAAATEGAFAPRLNTLDLAIFHYVSWLPCSFSCPLSLAFADAVATHIEKRHGQFLARGGGPRAAAARCPPGCRHEAFVRSIDAALAAHRLVVLEDVQVSIAGTFDGARVHVDRAWPTARDRHPDAALDEDAREAVARVVALVEAAGTVAVEDGVLVAGGTPVLRSPEALLAPFGARTIT